MALCPPRIHLYHLASYYSLRCLPQVRLSQLDSHEFTCRTEATSAAGTASAHTIHSTHSTSRSAFTAAQRPALITSRSASTAAQRPALISHRTQRPRPWRVARLHNQTDDRVWAAFDAGLLLRYRGQRLEVARLPRSRCMSVDPTKFNGLV